VFAAVGLGIAKGNGSVGFNYNLSGASMHVSYRLWGQRVAGEKKKRYSFCVGYPIRRGGEEVHRKIGSVTDLGNAHRYKLSVLGEKT